MRRTILVLLVAATMGIVACSGKKPKDEAPAQTPVSANSGADSSGIDAAGANAGDDESAGPQGGLLSRRIIYFDFDSSEIRGEGTEIVAAHAKSLAGGQGMKVRLEGHTDERGSREYNIGLGERRAQAVRRAMLLQGAAESQITTVSYGEERPAAAGSDESAWAQNRRVEIVYLK
jgi:peptidoglycan-associated lipoprotein